MGRRGQTIRPLALGTIKGQAAQSETREPRLTESKRSLRGLLWNRLLAQLHQRGHGLRCCFLDLEELQFVARFEHFLDSLFPLFAVDTDETDKVIVLDLRGARFWPVLLPRFLSFLW